VYNTRTTEMMNVAEAATETESNRLPKLKNPRSRKHPMCGRKTVRRRPRTATDNVAPAAPDARAKAEEAMRALEKRALLAEGRLREAELRALDMESRALAAEELIAGRRKGW